MHEERANLLLPTLQQVWGFPTLRSGQHEVINAWSQGREVVALLPTGGGKSMCYQLPALVERALGRGTTLVVSPLLALMQDQVESLRARGVVAAALNSTLSRGEQEEVETALEAQLLDVLFVSPERAATPQFRRLLGSCTLALIAVDEAHCVSTWGHNFRPEYMQLGELRQISSAPLMALTATATPRVVREIVSGLQLREPVVICGDFARPNLRFSVSLESRYEARMELLVATLTKAGFRGTTGGGKAIVYCASRKKCEMVVAGLKSDNFRVDYYHAGRSLETRSKVQSSFECGRLRVLVATNAFGMGIDYPDVRVLVHFQAPGSLEAYYQEAGRASRDGEVGHCLMFFSPGDLVLQRRLVGNASDRSRSNQSLEILEAYALATRCRQRILCQHFNPDVEGRDCGCCDVCASEEQVLAGLDVKHPREQCVIFALPPGAQDTIVAGVANLKRPMGKSVLAKALRGSKAKTVRKLGLLEWPEHGLLAEFNEPSIVAAMDSLLRNGRLVPKGRKYPTLWVPGKAVRASKLGLPIEVEQGGAAGRKTSGAMRKRGGRGSNLKRALELYRNRTAKKLSWKPYMVMHKKVIAQLEQQRPKSLEELHDIDGLGPVKVDRFGWELLDIVRRYGE